ncbi:MAG: hypothetical protein RIT15_1216 [Pseudomonadota bacterium]
MSVDSLATLTQQVLWSTFFFSTIFGFAAQRSHFCTMGAVSDIVNLQDWTRMHMWATAVAVAMFGFAGLSYMGTIDPSKALYSSPKVLWLSTWVGGLMFGFGMVLASGCANKTLLRISSGSLKSLVVFIVMGVAAFATLKGITAVLRVNTVDLFSFTAPMLSVTMRLILSIVIGLALLVWAIRNPQMRSMSALLPSVVIGAVIVSIWYVSGKLGYVQEHPDTLQEAFLTTNSGRMESLSFVAPVAYVIDWLMLFSDKSKVLTLGMSSVFGVVLGGFLEARVSKTFRWEGFGSIEDLANHLGGAVLMGVGGVTAMGCTIGQGLSGVSTLALGSFIALAGIVIGAMLAFKYQIWRLDRM